MGSSPIYRSGSFYATALLPGGLTNLHCPNNSAVEYLLGKKEVESSILSWGSCTSMVSRIKDSEFL